MRGLCKPAIAAALWSACGASVVCAQIQTATESLARTGDVAAGTSLNYSLFRNPALNNAGYYVFSAELAGATSTTNDGIWAGSPGSFSLVAREGAAAPDYTGSGSVGTFNFLTINPFENNPLVESQSQVAFFGYLEGPGISFGVNNNGLWAGSPGNIKLVARTGDAAPGVAGETFSLIRPSAFISGAIIAFNAQTRNPLNQFQPAKSGAWAGTQGAVQNYALEGEQAGDAPTGVLYGFNNFVPTVNSDGYIAFRTQLTDTDGNPNNNAGVFLGNSKANMKLIARADDAVPGTSGDVRFASFVSQPGINASEQIAFHANLGGTSVTIDNDTAILRSSYTSTTPVVIAREGAQAGGMATGVNYGQIESSFTMNSAAEVVFIAELTGAVDSSNNRAIFKSNGSTNPVARKGDAAPGTPSGVVIALDSFTSSSAVNAGGQVAFVSRLTGPGVTVSNQTALFALDPWNQLVKVAREGDAIEIAPSVSKTIGFGLGFHTGSGGGEGRQTSFNQNGQLAFTAPFTDGTSAVLQSRVGGAVRIHADAPTLGAAVGNGFFTSTPLPADTYGAVNGAVGYLKFVTVSGPQVNILLDFNGTNTAGAMAELNRNASIYGYTVSSSSIGSFDALITYANASEDHFYWNFANIDNLSLVGVQIAPEPGSIGLGLIGCLFLARRRRW